MFFGQVEKQITHPKFTLTGEWLIHVPIFIVIGQMMMYQHLFLYV